MSEQRTIEPEVKIGICEVCGKTAPLQIAIDDGKWWCKECAVCDWDEEADREWRDGEAHGRDAT
jgi:hypothetical protein